MFESLVLHCFAGEVGSEDGAFAVEQEEGLVEAGGHEHKVDPGEAVGSDYHSGDTFCDEVDC